MDLSNQALLIGYAIVFAIAGALLWYIITGSKRAKDDQANKAYRWTPETDFDVIQKGEGPLTPPWPELRAKEGKVPDHRKTKQDNSPPQNNDNQNQSPK